MKSYYERDIYTLTNDEIVSLVDCLFPNDGKFAEFLPSDNYRKVEVGFSKDDWYFICKVSFGVDKDHISHVTAFDIQNSGDEDDFYITSVSDNGLYKKEWIEKQGINLDFSTFYFGIKKLYDFFNETLKMWTEPLGEHKKNPYLLKMVSPGPSESYIVQEVFREKVDILNTGAQVINTD